MIKCLNKSSYKEGYDAPYKEAVGTHFAEGNR